MLPGGVQQTHETRAKSFPEEYCEVGSTHNETETAVLALFNSFSGLSSMPADMLPMLLRRTRLTS